MLCTDFIAVMAINNETFPCDNGISATIGKNIRFQLEEFLFLKRPDQVLKLHVYLQLVYCFLTHSEGLSVSTFCNVLTGNTTARFSGITFPVRR